MMFYFCQEREEQEQIEEQRKRAYDAEMARLEREAKERERLRKIEEHKEIQKKHAMERIEQLKKTDIGAKVLQNLDEEVNPSKHQLSIQRKVHPCVILAPFH